MRVAVGVDKIIAQLNGGMRMLDAGNSKFNIKK
jgi:hypothetical protein